MQELDLAKDAIFPQRTSPAARNRYVYYPDHLVRMPHPSSGFINNISNLWREPVFQGTIWAAVTEITKNVRSTDVEDESIGDFFSRRFSRNMVDRLLSAVIHGIYAGDVWQLSAKSLFSGSWRDELDAGSVLGGFLKARAEGLEVTKNEADFLVGMKKFEWDPLLAATLKHTVAFTFRDGLSMLTDGLARYLMGDGRVEFKTSTPVHSIALSEDKNSMLVIAKGSQETKHYANVISALSPAPLNQVTDKEGRSLIPTIPSVTVMTVNLYYRTPDLNPAGFGYLIPQATSFENNPERALGVVFDTAYSPSAMDANMKDLGMGAMPSVDALKEAREKGQLININDFAWFNLPDKPNTQDDVEEQGTKLTVMLGGHYWDGWPTHPDEQEGLALAKSLLERHLGIKEEPEAWQVNLQKDCIPQYTVGHEQRLKTAHNNLWREYKGRLRVAGNWMWGVGVNDCLRSAWEVVQSLKDGKDGTGLEHVGPSEYVRIKPVRRGVENKDE